jgi:hypothetical protein
MAWTRRSSAFTSALASPSDSALIDADRRRTPVQRRSARTTLAHAPGAARAGLDCRGPARADARARCGHVVVARLQPVAGVRACQGRALPARGPDARKPRGHGIAAHGRAHRLAALAKRKTGGRGAQGRDRLAAGAAVPAQAATRRGARGTAAHRTTRSRRATRPPSRSNSSRCPSRSSCRSASTSCAGPARPRCKPASSQAATATPAPSISWKSRASTSPKATTART